MYEVDLTLAVDSREKCSRCSQRHPYFLVNCSSCGQSFCWGLLNHWKAAESGHACTPVGYTPVARPVVQFTPAVLSTWADRYTNPADEDAAFDLARVHSLDSLRAYQPVVDHMIELFPRVRARLEGEWTLITEYDCASSTFIHDHRDTHRQYIESNILSLEVKREYTTNQQRTYRIFTQNTKLQGTAHDGTAVYFGRCKHEESAAYGTEEDWGCQKDLRGAPFDSSHRAAHAKGQLHWQHNCLTRSRCTIRADDGSEYIAQRNTGWLHDHGWPLKCWGGGLSEGPTYIHSTGCGQQHGWERAGPEGTTRQDFSSQIGGLQRICVYVKVFP
jgi:hypothetical protein